MSGGIMGPGVVKLCQGIPTTQIYMKSFEVQYVKTTWV